MAQTFFTTFEWIFGVYRKYARTHVDNLVLQVDRTVGGWDWTLARYPGGYIIGSLDTDTPVYPTRGLAVLAAEAYFIKTFYGGVYVR